MFNRELRKATAYKRAMAKVDRKRAKRDLQGVIKALRHEHEAVRLHAVEALGAMRDERAIPALKAVAYEPADSGGWPFRSAMLSLRKIGGPAGATALLDLFVKPPSMPAHERWHVSAAQALGQLGDARAIEPLKAWVYYAGSVEGHEAGVLGIAAVRDEHATIALLDLMGGPGDPAVPAETAETVRTFVALVLGARGDERAIEPLKAFALEATTDKGRATAAKAIARIGGPAADAIVAVEPFKSWLVEPRPAAAAGPAPAGPGEVAALTDELVGIGNTRGFITKYSDDKRTREIGQRLHEIGGKPLMKQVYQEVAEEVRRPARELDKAWNRVGDWLG